MPDPPPGPDAPPDPRIERTRIHVLKHARRLIATAGPTSVTYSVLAIISLGWLLLMLRHYRTFSPEQSAELLYAAPA